MNPPLGKKAKLRTYRRVYESRPSLDRLPSLDMVGWDLLSDKKGWPEGREASSSKGRRRAQAKLKTIDFCFHGSGHYKRRRGVRWRKDSTISQLGLLLLHYISPLSGRGRY